MCLAYILPVSPACISRLYLFCHCAGMEGGSLWYGRYSNNAEKGLRENTKGMTLIAQDFGGPQSWKDHFFYLLRFFQHNEYRPAPPLYPHAPRTTSTTTPHLAFLHPPSLSPPSTHHTHTTHPPSLPLPPLFSLSIPSLLHPRFRRFYPPPSFLRPPPSRPPETQLPQFAPAQHLRAPGGVVHLHSSVQVRVKRAFRPPPRTEDSAHPSQRRRRAVGAVARRARR